MTPIFFLLFYFIGLGLTIFRHPIFGLYTYLFTFYMAPSEGWWRNEIPDLRYLFIAAVIAAAACLSLPNDANRAKWHQTGVGRLLILFVIYNWAQILWAVNRDLQIEGAVLFSKHLVSFYLFYKLSSTLKSITNIAFAHVVGCSWFGYQALGAGGGRLETIGGAVAGSNELGVHITTGIIIGGILIMIVAGIRRWIMFGGMPLIVNCLVLTMSRGSILGLVGGGLAGYFFIPKGLKKKYRIFGLLGLTLFAMVAHDPLIERIEETYLALTTDAELDSSAAKRTEIAKAGFRIALDHPFGAGHRGTAVLSPKYMDESLLSKTSGVRSAHNTSAAVVAEHGFPGILLYFLIIAWVIRTMFQIARDSDAAETSTYRSFAAFTTSALIAVYVSGNFSNNIGLETQYWCLAFLASLSQLVKSRLREEIHQNSDITTKSTDVLAHRH